MEELNTPRAEHIEINERLAALLEALKRHQASGGKPVFFDIYPVDANDSNAGYAVDGWEGFNA